MNLDYLKEIGCTQEEIDSFMRQSPEYAVSELAEYPHEVSENLKFIIADLGKARSLNLAALYPDSFTMDQEEFMKRMDKFKAAFPSDWKEILEEQLWGFPELSDMNVLLNLWDEPCFEKAVSLLKNPGDADYEFLDMLSKEAGIDISFEDLGIERSELRIWEISRYEIVDNAKMLIEEGLPKDIIENILCNGPFLMMFLKNEVKGRLEKGFGENYVEAMTDIYENDYEHFREILEDIAW